DERGVSQEVRSEYGGPPWHSSVLAREKRQCLGSTKGAPKCRQGRMVRQRQRGRVDTVRGRTERSESVRNGGGFRWKGRRWPRQGYLAASIAGGRTRLRIL